MTTDYIWLEPILIFFLILANGFFAASEIAMIAMRKSRIDALVERGVRSAAVVARLKADPDRFLATVQIGVTVISTFASAIGGAAASGYLKPQIAALPFSSRHDGPKPLRFSSWSCRYRICRSFLASWCPSPLHFDIRSRSPALSLARSILSPGSPLLS